jgi:biopolymer transport protein ExbD
MAKQTVTVYINERFEYMMDIDGNGNAVPVNLELMRQTLENQLRLQAEDASVVLRTDRTVPVQYVVSIFDVVNGINETYQTKYKVILATRPDKSGNI